MRVTGPQAWLALGALALVVLAGALWSIVGSIPTQVGGQGILLRTGGVSQVVSTSAGILTELTVSTGDIVRPGDVLGRVVQPDLSIELGNARGALEAAMEQRSTLERLLARDADQQARLFQGQREEATRTMAEAAEQVAWYTARVKAEEDLLKQGLVTERQLFETKQGQQAQLERQERARTRLLEIAAAEQGWQSRTTQEREQATLRVGERERDLERVRRRLEVAATVVSPYEGRVVEVTAADGQLLAAGSPVATVEPLEGPLQALLFLSPADGKKVEAGMPVRLAPATVKPEEFGYILGTVQSVSSFPATEAGMMRTLQNEGLVKTLSAAGAPFEVYATLQVDSTTPSGYRWTSSRGPEIGLFSGTLAQALVTTRTQRPISLVIPYLRGWLGL